MTLSIHKHKWPKHDHVDLQVLTELAQTEVACSEFREKWGQTEVHVKTLKQHKKSLELVCYK